MIRLVCRLRVLTLACEKRSLSAGKEQKYASFDRRFQYNVHHAPNQMRGELRIEIQLDRTGKLIPGRRKKHRGAESY